MARDTPKPGQRPAATRRDRYLRGSNRRYAGDVSSPDRRSRGPGRRGRDRHGRGLRGRLVPASVPLARTRAEIFDDLVLDAVEALEKRYARELAGVEFAVEDVPPDLNVYDSDVLEDRSEERRVGKESDAG